MMKGNNYHEKVESGVALVPQTIATGNSANGATISEPWKKGRQLALQVLVGATAANTTGTLTVQGLRRSDGTTWEALKQNDGTTDLTFPAALFTDGGGSSIENGEALGTVYLDRVKSDVYKAVRVVATCAGSGGSLAIAVGYAIFDLVRGASSKVDQLFGLQIPA